jgi:hypothetical protein
MRRHRHVKASSLVRIAAATVIATAIAVAVAIPSHGRAWSTRACGVELWAVKALSDPQRKLVNLHPRNTTIAAINALPMPHPNAWAVVDASRPRGHRLVARHTRLAKVSLLLHGQASAGVADGAADSPRSSSSEAVSG